MQSSRAWPTIQYGSSPAERRPSLAKPEITVAHIQDLIDTNKALRESVISIAALLKEHTNITAYPGNRDRKSSVDSAKGGLNSWPRSRGNSRSGFAGVAEIRSTEIRLNKEIRKREYEENWIHVQSMSLEAIGEERMERRRTYEAHWGPQVIISDDETSEARCPSLLPDFDEWWSQAIDSLKTTTPQARKLSVALHTDLRYDVFVALFGSEFCSEWTSTSRALFEESRKLRFKAFLTKIQATGATKFFGDDLAQVLVEVAEWTKIVWTTEREGSQTLESLRLHCYRRGVLQQPDFDEYAFVELQNQGLLSLLYALDFRRWIDPGTSWSRVVSQLNVDVIPLNTLIPHVDKLNGWIGKMASRCHNPEPSKTIHVHPEEFHVRTLRDLGDIEITWTSELEMHLRLTPDAKKLFVFEYPTWLFGRHFHADPENLEVQEQVASMGDYNKIFQDLAQTYALLFGPVSKKENKLFRNAQKADELNTFFCGQRAWYPYMDAEAPNLKRVELSPTQYPARDFLENFRTVKVSPSQARASDLDPTCSTMADLLATTKSPPDDVAVMMLAIIRNHTESTSLSYSGIYFEEQLRILKGFMDGKKPRTICQLWRDARDATSWWTFWTVLFFGVLSITLALGSLVVSIAQTVGTFEAIH